MGDNKNKGKPVETDEEFILIPSDKLRNDQLPAKPGGELMVQEDDEFDPNSFENLSERERRQLRANRWLALKKIAEMIRSLDKLIVERLHSEEYERQRRNIKIGLLALVIPTTIFGLLMTFGVIKLMDNYWSAQFYLKSAWAYNNGVVRVIAKATNLTEEEKYEKFDTIKAKIYDVKYDVWSETKVLPIYMKNGDILLSIFSRDPVALAGPCQLEVVLENGGKIKRKIPVKNLLVASGSVPPGITNQ